MVESDKLISFSAMVLLKSGDNWHTKSYNKYDLLNLPFSLILIVGLKLMVDDLLTKKPEKWQVILNVSCSKVCKDKYNKSPFACWKGGTGDHWEIVNDLIGILTLLLISSNLVSLVKSFPSNESEMNCLAKSEIFDTSSFRIDNSYFYCCYF